jgi:type I restriction enzyme S subunit
MIVPFSEIVDTQKGKNPPIKSKTKLDGYIPYIDIKAFERGIFDIYTDGNKCLLCDDNDILLVWDGARAGLVGVAYKGAVGSTLVKIDVPLVEKKYVLYFLKYFSRELNAKPKGTGIPHINPTLFNSLPFPLSPLPEQQRIVAKIDSLFLGLENGVTLLKTIKAQLAIYKQAVLKWAFEGKLTNSKLLKEENLKKFIEKPRYGTSKKCTSENIGTKVYRIPNINYQTGIILQDDLKYAEFSEDEKESLHLKRDDILIIRSNGSVNLVGRASIVRDVDIDGLFAGYLMRLRIVSNNLIPKFLLFYLSSPNARLYIETTAKSTSGVNNINSEEICRLQLPYFDVNEQLAIVSAIESRLSVCDKLEQTIDQTLALSVSLRQSILKKAFEGRLVPQDLNDESAEKLLERIKAEKAAVSAKQKQKRGGK